MRPLLLWIVLRRLLNLIVSLGLGQGLPVVLRLVYASTPASLVVVARSFAEALPSCLLLLLLRSRISHCWVMGR